MTDRGSRDQRAESLAQASLLLRHLLLPAAVPTATEPAHRCTGRCLRHSAVGTRSMRLPSCQAIPRRGSDPLMTCG